MLCDSIEDLANSVTIDERKGKTEATAKMLRGAKHLDREPATRNDSKEPKVRKVIEAD